MLSSRNLMASKPKFYRGISLKQYVQSDRRNNEGIRYKDDQTILLDQRQEPISLDQSVIFVVSSSKSVGSKFATKRNSTPQEFLKPRLNIGLPTLKMKKGQYLKSKSLKTDRNSTDASQSNENEVILPAVLPSLNKKNVIRQRNITMASRSSSRQTSCRKKVSPTFLEADQLKNEGLQIDQSILINRLPLVEHEQKKEKYQMNLRKYLSGKDAKNSYFESIKLVHP